jgi:uncharacterized protein YsxB (DUF464 family)
VAAQRHGGRLVRFEVTGHAGFARPGEDIVCAGVSALIQSAAHGLVRHCKAHVHVHDHPDGAYVLELLDPRNACARGVLETTLSGLRAIARSYPRNLSVAVRSTGARRQPAEHVRPRKGA